MNARMVRVMPLVVLVALTGCKNRNQQAANNAPAVVQAAAPATPITPPPATAPVPPKTTEPVDEEAIKRENALKRFLSLPDPKPPVALDKIEGEWWTDDEYADKVFAFVEEITSYSPPLRYSLSLSNGTKLNVMCVGGYPVNKPADSSMGLCRVPPLFHWVRLAAGDVITNPDSEHWGLSYRGKDYFFVSNYLVENVCYRDGNCMSLEEAGHRAQEKLREKARRGEN